VVARELGVPAVVAVEDATTLIPDGSLIRIDGSNGTVTLLGCQGGRSDTIPQYS
jgi:pyruvate,water dikinase